MPQENEDFVRPETYWVYIVRCSDNTLYTGISNDVEHRIEVHNSGAGAKYTRSRKPVELVYCEKCADKPAALCREIAIKQLNKTAKIKLIEDSLDA